MRTGTDSPGSDRGSSEPGSSDAVSPASTTPEAGPVPGARPGRAARPEPLTPSVLALTALAVLGSLTGWAAVAVVTQPWLVSDDGGPVFHLDAWIYRTAVEQWRAGGSLYDWWVFPAEHMLPFTYPPFAAWAFTPLTWVDHELSQTLLTVATPVAVAVTIWACLRSVLPGDLLRSAGRRGPGLSRPVVLAVAVPWLTVVSVALVEPVYKTMEYGQVNAVLMALVAVDLLVVPRGSRWRGVLSGLAAAFKLTPAIAVLVLLARREWRAAATMVAGALVVTVGAAVASPLESWQFFSRAMWDPTRAGNADYAGNQNLRAVLARAWPTSLPEHGTSLVWAAVVAASIVGAWLLLRRLEPTGVHGRGRTDAEVPGGRGGSTVGDPVGGGLAEGRAGLDPAEGTVPLLQVSVTMVLGLLISPISWSHHWVWAVPALIALVAAAIRWRRVSLLAVAGGGGVVYLLAAHWWFTEGNHIERDWPWWQQLLGSSYTWWALGAGVVVGLTLRRDRVPTP
ncbi:glycosyltransferase 87 family protein [Actinomyces respiraculi]|uniref:glycosyltransferase 87 family protein n=1 Tax=Actinomyces respiraculi TaxID=2744574 RepID=UPI001F3CF218|nr:glycosyltransferase 87 family protein [Actinomyces respiraculi]